MFDTPILMITYNRPEHARAVFNAIKRVKPKRFFIAADGPKNEYDNLKIEQSLAIINDIDWECELKTLIRKENLGCGKGPASAISWFFENVEEGIILEDDCLPNESFFDFCQKLLTTYRFSENVMMISGTSYQAEQMNENSYYFSKYVHVWGWATWRRAWKNYDYRLDGDDDQSRKAIISKTFSNPRERAMWRFNMDIIINGLDAWDYQWMYCIWKNDGLSIIPWKNMVSNIGFGQDATHTTDANSHQSNMKRHLLEKIYHPKEIKKNRTADQFERYSILIEPSLKYYKKRLASLLNRIADRLKNG